MFNQMCESCPSVADCKVPDSIRILPPEAVLAYELLRLAGAPQYIAVRIITAPE